MSSHLGWVSKTTLGDGDSLGGSEKNRRTDGLSLHHCSSCSGDMTRISHRLLFIDSETLLVLKNMPETCSIDFACYKHLLLKMWVHTVFGTFLQIKSANMHSWNIFLVFIKAASMLASTQIKMVKPQDKFKARHFWHGSSFLHLCSVNFNSSGRNCITTFLWLGCFKRMLA